MKNSAVAGRYAFTTGLIRMGSTWAGLVDILSPAGKTTRHYCLGRHESLDEADHEAVRDSERIRQALSAGPGRVTVDCSGGADAR